MAEASIPTAEWLPVLSMWQPYASLLFEWDRDRGEFFKAWETRSFKLPERFVGKPILIHATAKLAPQKFLSRELCDACYDAFGCAWNFSLPRGAVIGIVQFERCLPTEDVAPYQPASEIAAGDWSPGRWAWHALSAERLPMPIPAKGMQGWWRFPASAMSAGTAETHSGSGLQPASAVANGETSNSTHGDA